MGIGRPLRPSGRRTIPGGFLVAFEGIDGAGKSTQAEGLARRVDAAGYDCVLSREPTDGPWGKKIRASRRAGRLPPDEELRAFVEDRREHVASLVRPGLEAGRFVVLDRYYFSTVAYQGARGFDPGEILATNESFAPEPDLLVLVEIPAEVALARIASRGGPADLFEGLERLAKSAAIFDSIEKSYLLRIDGERPADEIGREVDRGFTARLSEVARARIGTFPAGDPRIAELREAMRAFAPVG